MVVERNIYYYPQRVIHKYHVRISKKNKLVFFRSCATLEEARREKDIFFASVE